MAKGSELLLKSLLGIEPAEIKAMAERVQQSVINYEAVMTQVLARLEKIDNDQALIKSHLGIITTEKAVENGQ